MWVVSIWPNLYTHKVVLRQCSRQKFTPGTSHSVASLLDFLQALLGFPFKGTSFFPIRLKLLHHVIESLFLLYQRTVLVTWIRDALRLKDLDQIPISFCSLLY